MEGHMNSKSGRHDREHLDLVFLYVLHALPPREIAVAEAQISACADCLREMKSLRPVIASFVSWPTDVLRPSALIIVSGLRPAAPAFSSRRPKTSFFDALLALWPNDRSLDLIACPGEGAGATDASTR